MKKIRSNFKYYLISQKPASSVSLAAVRDHPVHVWRGQAAAAEAPEAAGGEVPGAVPGDEACPVPEEQIQEVAAQFNHRNLVG